MAPQLRSHIPPTPSRAVLLFYARMLEGAMLLTAFDEARRYVAPKAVPIPVTVPELLDALMAFRETHCLSQTTMAELCGVVLATYQRWEWRQRVPQHHHLIRIRQLLSHRLPATVKPKPSLAQTIVNALTQMPTQRSSYRMLAAELRRPSKRVHMVCQTLVRQGTLRWCAPDVYAVAAKETAHAS